MLSCAFVSFAFRAFSYAFARLMTGLWYPSANFLAFLALEPFCFMYRNFQRDILFMRKDIYRYKSIIPNKGQDQGGARQKKTEEDNAVTSASTQTRTTRFRIYCTISLLLFSETFELCSSKLLLRDTFFTAVNHLRKTCWKTEVPFNRVRRSCLSVVIGRFRSILFVSVFPGSVTVAISIIDGSEKRTL